MNRFPMTRRPDPVFVWTWRGIVLFVLAEIAGIAWLAGVW